jgi:hypothetical protein
MKKMTVLAALVTCLCGCYPSYSVYLKNSSPESLFFRSYPPIESSYSKNSESYDSVIRIKVAGDTTFGVYELKSMSQFRIYSHVGKVPFADEIPFDSMEFIRNNDTLKLPTKQRIYNIIKPEQKKGVYFFDVQSP